MSFFDSDKFKPMERIVGKPTITVTPSGLAFSKQAVSKLSYSEYVQIFINKEEKLLGIRTCQSNDSNAIKFVNKSRKKVEYVRWNNLEFVKDVNTLVEDSVADLGYKVEGEYFEDDGHDALLFDFKNLKIITENL